MSPLAGSNNNRGVPPGTSDTSTSYQRDPNYYYPDGSVVILVDNVLFKFQASLVLSSGFGGSIDPASGNPTLQDRLASSSDDNPVRAKDFTPDQFRNFLKVVLGLPSDPSYLALLTGAQDTEKHERDLLLQYLDIASLSNYFGMTGLETWARKQLNLVLLSSFKFAHSHWDKYTLYRLHSYAYSRNGLPVRWRLRTFILFFISVSANIGQPPSATARLNFTTCIELYKDSALKQRDPALFGCTFTALASQHHHSGLWTLPLTQKDKALLYVAQVQLTSIAKALESLCWLTAPASELPFFTRLCPSCQVALPRLWTNTFGMCGGLNSSVLLEDISSLAHLPQHLYSLKQTWAKTKCMGSNSGADNHQTSSTGGLYSLLGSFGLSGQPATHESLPKEHTCSNNYLPEISALIDEVYRELATRHAEFEL